MSERKNYVCYHLHTEQSLADSNVNFKSYINKAVELNQKAICFTEHGNTRQNIDKLMYCKKNNIKYLHGVEIYVTATIEEKIRDNYHTILIAKNQDGVKEINNLVFISTDSKHKFYRNRISFDELFNISDNVIKISACIASPLSKYVWSGDNDSNICEKLLQVYDYYEIQYHTEFEGQTQYNKWLLKMSKKYNKPLIAGTDTHALDKYSAECRTILQLDKGITFEEEDECDLTYKSYKELCDKFEKQNSMPREEWLQAIENTNIMADMCDELDVDTSIKYPLLYDDDVSVMKDRINKMYKEKVASGIIDGNDTRYVKNIREEMRVFEKVNMVGFMLFMSELLCWCRENNIPTCPCRGSCGGSTVAFITNITDIDPVRFNMVFSRFCNEDRIEIGDYIIVSLYSNI